MIQGFVDTREACRLLCDISRQRLHFLQATGRIACVWINGRRIYKRDHVLRLRDELGRAEQFEMAISGDGKGN